MKHIESWWFCLSNFTKQSQMTKPPNKLKENSDKEVKISIKTCRNSRNLACYSTCSKQCTSRIPLIVFFSQRKHPSRVPSNCLLCHCPLIAAWTSGTGLFNLESQQPVTLWAWGCFVHINKFMDIENFKWKKQKGPWNPKNSNDRRNMKIENESSLYYVTCILLIAAISFHHH